MNACTGVKVFFRAYVLGVGVALQDSARSWYIQANGLHYTQQDLVRFNGLTSTLISL